MNKKEKEKENLKQITEMKEKLVELKRELEVAMDRERQSIEREEQAEIR